MIRTIDNQMMLQQTMEVSKIAGNKIGNDEHNRAFQAEMEKERVANEENSVLQAQATEHRRIQNDEKRKNQGDFFTDSEVYPHLKEKLEEKEEEAALNAWNVGTEIDITV
jgi:hypothetical protein